MKKDVQATLSSKKQRILCASPKMAEIEPECSQILDCLCPINLLDCPICFEPLIKAPVFQCFNGHIACSSCCTSKQLNNTCPKCSSKLTGYIRNRFVENILASAKYFCPYKQSGCEKTLSYNDIEVHAKTCMFVPCSCPCCDFVDSFHDLYFHFSDEHGGCAVQFTYDEFFSVTLNKVQSEVFVMQSCDGDYIFVLYNVVVDHHVGNAVYVVCIGPDWMKGRFKCMGCVENLRGGSVRFEDSVKMKQENAVAVNFGNIGASTEYFVIPSSFFDSDGKLKLNVKITQA